MSGEEFPQDTLTVSLTELHAKATQVVDEAVRGGHFASSGLARDVLRVLHGETQAVVLRCTGGCFEGSYDEPPAPEEDCPVHGRSYAEMWALAATEQQRVQEARVAQGRAEDRVRQAESERDNYRDALRNLVDLKDGPRDAHYEQAKPMAWDMARMLVGSQATVTEDTTADPGWVKMLEESLAQPQRLVIVPQPQDEVTMIVGPEGKVSQVIFHSAQWLTQSEVQQIADLIDTDPTAIVLGPNVRVRETLVVRLPADEDIVDAEEVTGGS